MVNQQRLPITSDKGLVHLVNNEQQTSIHLEERCSAAGWWWWYWITPGEILLTREVVVVMKIGGALVKSVISAATHRTKYSVSVPGSLRGEQSYQSAFCCSFQSPAFSSPWKQFHVEVSQSRWWFDALSALPRSGEISRRHSPYGSDKRWYPSSPSCTRPTSHLHVDLRSLKHEIFPVSIICCTSSQILSHWT